MYLNTKNALSHLLRFRIAIYVILNYCKVVIVKVCSDLCIKQCREFMKSNIII